MKGTTVKNNGGGKPATFKSTPPKHPGVGTGRGTPSHASTPAARKDVKVGG